MKGVVSDPRRLLSPGRFYRQTAHLGESSGNPQEVHSGRRPRFGRGEACQPSVVDLADAFGTVGKIACAGDQADERLAELEPALRIEELAGLPKVRLRIGVVI